MCDHIKLIHIYKDEGDIPSQLKENHCILNWMWNKRKKKKEKKKEEESNIRWAWLDIIDHMYPKIKIDLVLIQGTFCPDMARMISNIFKVPLPFMFIQCPARDFPYPVFVLAFYFEFFNSFFNGQYIQLRRIRWCSHNHEVKV